MSRFDQVHHGTVHRWTGYVWKTILFVAFLPVIIALVLQAVQALIWPIVIIGGLVLIGRLCLFGWQRRRQEW